MKRAAKLNNHAKYGSHMDQNDIITVTAPRCTEEGTILIQGEDNYFLKCQKNQATGGFFQIIYICPLELHSVEDTSKCIPPPNCEECGMTGDSNDIPQGYNGFVI